MKQGEGKIFIIVDAAMNDLIRPTLYEAHHDIKPVLTGDGGRATVTADVVGPVCEKRRITSPKGARPACPRAG